MKKWKDRTRGGTPVRIYAQDGGGAWPIHGAVSTPGGWVPKTWSNDGHTFFCSPLGQTDEDIIPKEPERIVIENVTFSMAGPNHCVFPNNLDAQIKLRAVLGKLGRLTFEVSNE